MWFYDPIDHFLPLEWRVLELYILLLNYVYITSTVSQYCQCFVIFRRIIIS